MSMASLFYLGLAVAGTILLVCYHRAGKLFRCMFFTAFTGLGALGLLWIAGRFIVVPVAVTPLSVLISGVLGIPGVVGMLLFHLI